MDTGKVVVAQYAYEPFGATTMTGIGNANPYKFTGREEDGTGLYFYRARYYHPSLGRFISEDPIEYDGGDINLYAYTSGDPVNFVDPAGLTFIGRIIVKGLSYGKKTLSNRMTREELIDAAKAGEDIKAKNFKSAKDIAEGASAKGKRPTVETDAATGKRHMHPNPRTGCHIIWGLAASLTVSHYVNGEVFSVTTENQVGAGILDLFNPLSLPQDILDTVNLFGGDENADSRSFCNAPPYFV
jgi:RHS repeat-associated protein